MFPGSVEKFEEVKSKILNPDGSVKEEYKGMKGYVQFALDHMKEIWRKLLNMFHQFWVRKHL